MTVLMLDNTLLELNRMMLIVRELYRDADVFVFLDMDELLEFAADKRVDIAILDVSAADSAGIEGARRLVAANPKINLIFATNDEHMPFNREIWALHASGYVLKPITREKLQEEMANLRFPIHNDIKLLVKCHGDFEVQTLEEKAVHFSRRKGKELLAYLIYRNGEAVLPREAAAVIFNDGECADRTMRYFEKIAATLVRDLRAVGAERVVVRSYNRIAVDLSIVKLQHHEVNTENIYMVQYDWAHNQIDYMDA